MMHLTTSSMTLPIFLSTRLELMTMEPTMLAQLALITISVVLNLHTLSLATMANLKAMASLRAMEEAPITNLKVTEAINNHINRTTTTLPSLSKNSNNKAITTNHNPVNNKAVKITTARASQVKLTSLTRVATIMEINPSRALKPTTT